MIKLHFFQRVILISIHAPTNGATGSRLEGIKQFNISIHAPTNGATEGIVTHYVRSRISIHAPTNGATQLIRCIFSVASHFNPRSDERSDCLETGIILNSWIFQSTLRRTERLYFSRLSHEPLVFQSTLRRTERPA